jgi:hypothetical protein
MGYSNVSTFPTYALHLTMHWHVTHLNIDKEREKQLELSKSSNAVLTQ